MRDGALGVVIIAVALVAALFASYLAGAETETREFVDYEYLTDVNGLFDWDKSAQYIEYDPSTNYTGYFSTETGKYFPTSLVDFVQYNDPETGNQGKINNYNLDIQPVASETTDSHLDWGRGSNYYTVYYHTSAYEDVGGQNHLWYTVEPMVESIADLAERLEVPQGLEVIFMSPDNQQPNITGPVAIYADNLTAGYDWMLFTMFTDRNNPGEWRYWSADMGYDYYDGILRLDIYNQDLSTGSNLVACLSCVYDPLQGTVTRYYDNALTQLCDVIDADSCLVVYGGSNHGENKLVLTSSIDWYTLVPQDKVYLDPTAGVWLKDNPNTATFTLIYSAWNGSSIPPQTYVASSFVGTHTFTVTADTPVRPGYEFKGWSTSNFSGQVQYRAGDYIQVVAGTPFTLYAVWKEPGDYGSPEDPLTGLSVSLKDIEDDAVIYITGNSQVSITGYDADAQGIAVYRLGVESISGDSIGLSITSDDPPGLSGTITSPGTLTVTVRMETGQGTPQTTVTYYTFTIVAYNSFKLGYNANGGYYPPQTQVYSGTEESHTFTISPTRPVYAGHEFLGWGTSSSADNPDVGSVVEVAKNTTVTLYAIWDSPGDMGTSASPLTGIDMALNDVPESSTIYIACGSSVNLPGYEPDTQGQAVYRFEAQSITGDDIGLAVTLDDPPGISGTVTSAGTSTVTVRMTLAQGTSPAVVSTYTITIISVDAFTLAYSAWDASFVPEDQTYYGDDAAHTFTVTANTPVRPGYIFLGWSTSNFSGQVQYRAGDSIQVAANDIVTLYAVWSNAATFGSPDYPLASFSQGLNTIPEDSIIYVAETADVLITGYDADTQGIAVYRLGVESISGDPIGLAVAAGDPSGLAGVVSGAGAATVTVRMETSQGTPQTTVTYYTFTIIAIGASQGGA